MDLIQKQDQQTHFSSVSQPKVPLSSVDIKTIFYHFGKVREVKISQAENFALVTYENIADAYLAQHILHNLYLEQQQVTLQLRWVLAEELKVGALQTLSSPSQPQFFS